MDPKTIIISRTDSIGDVIFTLPLAGFLKECFPHCKIVFLGQGYTRDVIRHCKNVDGWLDWSRIRNLNKPDQVNELGRVDADAIIHVFPQEPIARLAKKAGIPIRIGASGRWYHYVTCNRIVWFTRRRSSLHEAALNLKLLTPLGCNIRFNPDEIQAYYGLSAGGDLPGDLLSKIDPGRFNLIIHPRSKGSAREWGIPNFVKLIKILPRDRFNLFITGTKTEGDQVRDSLLSPFEHVHDLTGKLTLSQLIDFIQSADGLLAASTGPLHIAAALGKHALGLYPPIRPMHPGRWAPLGPKAVYFVIDKKCNLCRNGNECDCLAQITPEQVKEKLIELAHEKTS